MTSRAAPTSKTSSRAGNGSSISGSTTNPNHAPGRATSIRVAAALLFLGASATAVPARAGSTLIPDFARPDSATATLHVETLPPGLLVLVDGVRVGRSPVGPLWVPAKTIRIQAIPENPARFEEGRDTVVVTPKVGESVTAVIDLRPSVLLRTLPEPASLFLEHEARPDSLFGTTPVRILPARIEHRILRLEAPEHADTTLSGDAILALASAGSPVTISLRRVAAPLPPSPPRAPPLIRRRWFQIALIGAGAALTATSAILRHDADQWYDRYLSSSNPKEITRFYDRTTHYDRLAGASLGSGQVLLTAGIFLLVTSSVR